MSFDVPVLLLTFNRPDTTKIVFDAIRQVKPHKLYIYSDAPRNGNNDDEIKVLATRSIFETIDWECEIHKLYQKENLGCGPGVSEAISWIFKSEHLAVILEDDCVPNCTFFTFCRNMLFKYQNESQVMHIAGTRWNHEFPIEEVDYFFSRIGHIWGWATWRRAWTKYDYHMRLWEKYKVLGLTEMIFKDRKMARFWDKSFEQVYNETIKHTWDYQWQFALFLNNGLSVVPTVNLISNIGTTGVHASDNESPNLFKKTYDWIDRGRSPRDTVANIEFDKYHMLNHFLLSYPLIKRVKKAVRKIFSRL